MHRFNGMKIFCLVFLLTIFGSNLVLAGDSLEQGTKLFNERKLPEAKQIFESIFKSDDKNDTAAYYLGRIALMQDDYESSIDWLEKAIDIDENISDYHLWLGHANGIKAQRASVFKKPGAAKNVKKEYEKAVELNPDNVQARFGLLQFHMMAPGIMGGDKDKGRAQVGEIKKRDPIMGHQASALMYEMDEKSDLAEQEYVAMVAEAPDSLNLLYRLGFFFKRIKKYDKATGVFEKIIAQKPIESTAYFQIGQISAETGEGLESAESIMKKYFVTEPAENKMRLGYGHFVLGQIYQKGGKIDEARAEFEQALQLNPKLKQAEEAMKDLKK